MTPHDPMSELMSTLLDGELTQKQHEELGCLLRSDPEARRRYLDLLLLDSLLREQLGKDAMVGAVDMLGSTMSSSSDQTAMAPSPSRSKFRRLFLTAAICSCACAAMAALIGLAIFSGSDKPNPPDAVATVSARLTDVEGKVELLTVAGEIRDVNVGEEIHPGQSLRTVGDGSFAIVKYDGIGKLELNPGTQVRLIKEEAGTQGIKKIFLSQGVLRGEFDGAKSVASLVIATAHAEIDGPDSLFNCGSTPESTWLEVDRGQAKLVRQSDGVPMSVKQGFKTVLGLEPQRPQVLALPLAISRPEYEVQRAARAMAFTRDGRLVLAAHGEVWQLDAELRKETPLFQDKTLNTFHTLLSADARQVAFGFESTIHLCGIEDAKRIKTISTRIKSVRGFAQSANGNLVAMIHQPPRGPSLVRIWNTETGNVQADLTSPIPNLSPSAFSPDGRYLACGNAHGGVVVWDLHGPKELARFPSQSTSIEALAFAPDSRTLAVGLTNQLVFFDVAEARELKRMVEPGFAFRSLRYSPNGKSLAAGTSGGHVRLWRIANEQVLVDFKKDNRPIHDLEFSPDGRLLATRTSRPVRIWRLPNEI